MPFTIVRHDIVKMETDAIVNAANTDLAMGSGVCGAIFKAAGVRELQTACKPLAPIKTGEAVVTPGFGLPARYVIHAAGPVYSRQPPAESEQLLRSAYINALKRAIESGCESIAFPLISSGVYGYPKAEALRVATAAIRDFTREYDIDVFMVVFDKEALAVGEELLGAVKRYIDEYYVEERTDKQRYRNKFYAARDTTIEVDDDTLEAMTFSYACMPPTEKTAESASTLPQRLDDIVGQLDEPFATTLLRLIDASGKSDTEVYKRANIDRRLFSKMRSNSEYVPSKPTVLSFALALELTLEQTEDLLGRAGFTLSHSRKFDVIVEYFIANGRYDVFEINEVLFSYDQTLLGG